jgi:chromosome segregation ATPase
MNWLSLTNNIFKYTTAALIAILIATVVLYNSKVKSLNTQILELQLNIRTLEMNRMTLQESLNAQNDAILKLSKDRESAEEELLKWKNKKEKIRYRVIYKNLEKLDLKDDNCENLKNVINAVRNTTF